MKKQKRKQEQLRQMRLASRDWARDFLASNPVLDNGIMACLKSMPAAREYINKLERAPRKRK